jgi:hypothetical protein
MHSDVIERLRGLQSPIADSASSGSRTSAIEPHRERLGWRSRIWNWMSRAISLGILGRSSDYHMEEFNPSEEYWHEALAGKQSLLQVSASPAAESSIQK